MSATQTIISNVSNISFADNGKIEHDKIKTHEEEKTIIWLLTLLYLYEKQIFPSASLSSKCCLNGISCHRFTLGVLVRQYFEKTEYSRYGCVTGCTYKHTDDEVECVAMYIANLSKEERDKLSVVIEKVRKLANPSNVSDPNFFEDQFSFGFTPVTGGFSKRSFPFFNLENIFSNWDKNKFSVLMQVPQTAQKITPTIVWGVEIYDSSIIAAKPLNNKSLNYALAIGKNPGEQKQNLSIEDLKKEIEKDEKIAAELSEELKKVLEEKRQKDEEKKKQQIIFDDLTKKRNEIRQRVLKLQQDIERAKK